MTKTTTKQMMQSQRMEIKEEQKEDKTELTMLHPRGASSQLFPFPLHDYLKKDKFSFFFLFFFIG